MAYRTISLMLSTFEGVLVPHKHSSMLRIKTKFILDFIHALILLLGSFLLLARLSAVCEKKRLHPLLLPPVSFRFHSFYEQLEGYGVNGIWLMGWKPSQKAVCPLLHNPLADTSALAWLLVFEDFGSSSPVNGVSNGWITTFLQTSPSISAVNFFRSLCLVITSPPFGQDKTCCKHVVTTNT